MGTLWVLCENQFILSTREYMVYDSDDGVVETIRGSDIFAYLTKRGEYDFGNVMADRVDNRNIKRMYSSVKGLLDFIHMEGVSSSGVTHYIYALVFDEDIALVFECYGDFLMVWNGREEGTEGDIVYPPVKRDGEWYCGTSGNWERVSESNMAIHREGVYKDIKKGVLLGDYDSMVAMTFKKGGVMW